MSRALAANLSAEAAIDLIFPIIAAANYIPETAHGQYLQALKKEYLRRRDGAAPPRNNELKIKILGPGCVSCRRLNEMVINILQEMGKGADIVHIHDLDEIWRHGVTTTPALIINDSIKCAGQLPTSSAVREWLQEEMTP